VSSDESQDQNRHQTEEEEEEKKSNEKTDTIDDETRRRISVNVGCARVFDWWSDQRGEIGKRTSKATRRQLEEL